MNCCDIRKHRLVHDMTFHNKRGIGGSFKLPVEEPIVNPPLVNPPLVSLQSKRQATQRVRLDLNS
jgi:hypothetical protein